MRADARRRQPMIGAAAVALLAAGLGGCTDIENAMASVPFLNFMHEAPFFDPYEAPRPAPPNAVPVSSPMGDYWEPNIPTPVTEAALNLFAAELTNPLPMSEAVLAEGRARFETYCSVCHGPQGEGNGPIVGPGKFPMGPDLRIPNTVARSDGYVYAIIKAGRGLMPSYRRIPPEERWAIVNYVRQLQGQGPAQTGAAATGGTPAGGQE